MASTTEVSATKSRVRRTIQTQLAPHVDVARLGDGDNLYEAGMDSHASVNLMIALETDFDIEFPNRMLKRSVFETVDSITAAVEQLLAR